MTGLIDPFICLEACAWSCPPGRTSFIAPRSYTRQDVVELHVSGSPAAATATLAALLDGGARQADPGEFTARAFLAGRIDLAQVEAVAGLVNAASDAALRSAAGAMDGRVGRLCGEAAAEAAGRACGRRGVDRPGR